MIGVIFWLIMGLFVLAAADWRLKASGGLIPVIRQAFERHFVFDNDAMIKRRILVTVTQMVVFWPVWIKTVLK